jgi:hypothetical protein
VKDLRELGCSVFQLDNPVDLLVGFRGRNFLFEVKDPDQIPSRRKLSESQQSFFESWRGQVHKIETFEEAVKIFENTMDYYESSRTE